MTEHIEKIGARLRYVEKIFYPLNWSFKPHYHDCFHFFAVKERTATLLVEGVKLHCPTGGILIVPPGAVHSLVKKETNAPVVIEMLLDVMDPFLSDRLLHGPRVVQANSYVWHMVDRVADLGNSRLDDMSRCAHYSLWAMLSELSITAEDLNPLSLNSQFIDMTDFSDLTKSIIVYVDRNYSHAFTLEDIAAEVGYCKSYICTTFKNDTGTTVNDYLNLVRINHIAEHLSFSDEDVSYICRQCGFQSTSHFNRTFKKFMGVSPRSYKRIRPPHVNVAALENTDMDLEPTMLEKLKGILERIGSLHSMSRFSVSYYSEKDEPPHA